MTKQDIRQILDDNSSDDVNNNWVLTKAEVDIVVNEIFNQNNKSESPDNANYETLTINELYAEYENIMGTKLSDKDKIIFAYAYTVGKNKLDRKNN